MILVTIIFSYCLIPITFFIQSITMELTWNWFVAETFNIKELNFYEAVGLLFFINSIFYMRCGDLKKKYEGIEGEGKIVRKVATDTVIGPLFSLFLDYIWHSLFLSPSW